eukprot:7794663-Pyramimonas_sp.AAC.1
MIPLQRGRVSGVVWDDEAHRGGRGAVHNVLRTIGPPAARKVGALDEFEQLFALDLSADLLAVLAEADVEFLWLLLGVAGLEPAPPAAVGQLERLARVSDMLRRQARSALERDHIAASRRVTHNLPLLIFATSTLQPRTNSIPDSAGRDRGLR